MLPESSSYATLNPTSYLDSEGCLTKNSKRVRVHVKYVAKGIQFLHIFIPYLTYDFHPEMNLVWTKGLTTMSCQS